MPSVASSERIIAPRGGLVADVESWTRVLSTSRGCHDRHATIGPQHQATSGQMGPRFVCRSCLEPGKLGARSGQLGRSARS